TRLKIVGRKAGLTSSARYAAANPRLGDTFRIATDRNEILRILNTSGNILRIQLERPAERRFRGFPIPFVEEFACTERRIGFAQRIIEGEGFFRESFGFGEHLSRSNRVKGSRTHYGITIRKSGVCPREIRILDDSLVEMLDRHAGTFGGHV